MDIPVLTAVTGARWEADLIAAFERGVAGVRVVRRCVDLADLLAAAASGTARAALVRPDLRRLDRAAVSRLGADGLAVVGVVDPDDEPGDRWLRQLGVTFVVPADTGVSDVNRGTRSPGALATSSNVAGSIETNCR